MLKVQGLCKEFKLAKKVKGEEPRAQGKIFKAVSELTFEARRGEVVGLLGANGAGKTTTLRLLSGILKPSSGSIECELANFQEEPSEYRRQLGFLSGSKGLYDRLTVHENLNYFGRLYGMNRADIKSRIEELSQMLELSAFLHRKVSELSTGMRQRASIARALIHDPQLVILDEPTTGLDIVATERVLQCIEKLKAAGKTLLFATHHMHEVDLLCDRILVIDQGRSRFFGNLPEFLSHYETECLNRALRQCLKLGEQG